MKKLIIGSITLLFIIVGCAAVHIDDEETSIHTLGIAAVEECQVFEGREDLVVEECTSVETAGFSGWKEIVEGIGNVVLRIMTFGMMGN